MSVRPGLATPVAAPLVKESLTDLFGSFWGFSGGSGEIVRGSPDYSCFFSIARRVDGLSPRLVAAMRSQMMFNSVTIHTPSSKTVKLVCSVQVDEVFRVAGLKSSYPGVPPLSSGMEVVTWTADSRPWVGSFLEGPSYDWLSLNIYP